MKFEGKTVIITGASRGIGRATALRFAQLGANVLINYHSSEEEADSIVAEISALGRDSTAVQADVSDEKQVAHLFDECNRSLGTPNILVNNAGVSHPSVPVEELSVEDWDRTFAVNARGVFLCSREAIKCIPEGGSIVNVASIRSFPEFGRAGIIDYCAAKAAVVSFTKTLAQHIAPKIRVNAVAPGFTETDIAKSWDAQTRKNAEEQGALKRIIAPEEIASSICFLASEDSSAMTGSVVTVDAGYCLKS